MPEKEKESTPGGNVRLRSTRGRPWAHIHEPLAVPGCRTGCRDTEDRTNGLLLCPQRGIFVSADLLQGVGADRGQRNT